MTEGPRTLVRQPQGSNLCGQAVLAMLKGISLEAACHLIGHRRGTHTRDLVRALGPVTLTQRLQRVSKNKPIPNVCILKIRWDDSSRSHFVLKEGNVIFDPSYPEPCPFRKWSKIIRGKATSFLPLDHSVQNSHSN